MKPASFLCCFVIALCAVSCCFADDIPGVDVAEVLRRGDSVEHVDGYCQPAGPESAVFEAMELPSNDADKWFISILTTQRCNGCTELQKKWRSDEWLLSLANPDDKTKSWAHYAVYDSSDTSQAFRFTNLKVKAFPTVVVQPPRSGKYGEPSTVVYQGVYTGDTRKLAEAISSAVRLYVERLAEVQAPSQGWQQAPWQPTPRNDTSDEKDDSNSNTGSIFPKLLNSDSVDIPPIEVTIPDFPWTTVIGMFLTGAWPFGVGAIGIWVFLWWRAKRKAAGEKLVFDGDMIDTLAKKVFAKLTSQSTTETPSTEDETLLEKIKDLLKSDSAEKDAKK